MVVSMVVSIGYLPLVVSIGYLPLVVSMFDLVQVVSKVVSKVVSLKYLVVKVCVNILLYDNFY
jgi:hypothetical protein